MRILLSGAEGFLGSALCEKLEPRFEILALSRRPLSRPHVRWNPESESPLDPAPFVGVTHVIHLAGESIAGRWTKARMKAIRESRVGPTRRLAEALSKLSPKPVVMLCPSGANFYGDRGAEALDESSDSGPGFLAEVCREWEAATEPAAAAGIRVCNLRLGVVLDPAGGALAAMLPVFCMGLGGPLGPGTQYFPWIARRDAVRAIEFLLDREDLSGPFNIVAPREATNFEFTKALGAALRRPTFLRVPAWALRLAVGKLADDALLASVRIAPRRLLDAGFEFEDPEIDFALIRMLRPPDEIKSRT
jgi:uncharacterized protein (TIGR01777 family)